MEACECYQLLIKHVANIFDVSAFGRRAYESTAIFKYHFPVHPRFENDFFCAIDRFASLPHQLFCFI